ncbi:MAG: hypothetical protein IKB01_08155 [Lachnospiraceae bacterium]|nr:hypothetical protein [Lachnospiraceae bacterium]
MDYRYQPYRMPFYMTYPMQNLYLTEMEYEKDMERMKELYPREVKRIQDMVDEECDKMEYEGSLMFDEYPDRMMLEQITDRIADRMRETEGKNLEASQRRDDLRNLIGVLLNHEMYRRRCRHRRCNRWW